MFSVRSPGWLGWFPGGLSRGQTRGSANSTSHPLSLWPWTKLLLSLSLDFLLCKMRIILPNFQSYWEAQASYRMGKGFGDGGGFVSSQGRARSSVSAPRISFKTWNVSSAEYGRPGGRWRAQTDRLDQHAGLASGVGARGAGECGLMDRPPGLGP